MFTPTRERKATREKKTTLANMPTTMRQELGLTPREFSASARHDSSRTSASRQDEEDEASAASECAREEVTRAPSQAVGLARLVLHPHCRSRVAWDVLSTSFLLYNIVVVPFRLCFLVELRCPQSVWLFEVLKYVE